MVDINLFILMLACFISYFCTFCFVPIFSFLAIKLNLMDVPNGAIKKHAKPTPYLGGVAVYCGFLSGVTLSFSLTNTVLFLLIGTTPLLALGLLDDIAPLKPYGKFFGQCVVAIFLLQIGMYLKGQFFNTYWYMPLFFLWFLTIVNAFNLIDVMDGLATVIALGAVSSFLSIAFISGSNEIVIPLAAFGSALLAFLWYNRPPAQIYLGDAGSLWIGGFLAITPLFFSWSSYNTYGYLTPIIILGIPLLEIFSLIVIRSYKGLPFYLGSPHHFCHYLQSNGWSKQIILLYVGVISIILNVVACLYVQGVINLIALLGIAFSLLCLWLVFLTFKP